jgi:8-oxo-dGTP pyrophosphatase MutT (NUDIX family)
MQAWHPRREDYSAGGVAYRRDDDHAYEIAVIATQGGTRWQLPKGTREAGETSEETALREVEEEVGLRTVCEAWLNTVRYWYWDTFRKTKPELVHKHVEFYLLRVVGGELSDDSIEVDATAWLSPEEALELLAFPGEKETVRLAMEHFHFQR